MCNPKQPKSLAKAIEKTLLNEKKSKQMANKGQMKVKELLDIKNTSKKMCSVYHEILDGTRNKGAK